MEQTGSKLEKEDVKTVYCHPASLTSLQSTLPNARQNDSQARVNIAGRNINNLRYTDYITFTAENKEDLKAS